MEGYELQKVLESIKTGQLQKVYTVHGPEAAWHTAVYKALHDRVAESGFGDWNWSVYHGSKDFLVDELLTDMATLPWGSGEKVAVLKDAHLVPAEELERLAKWLKEHEPPGCLAAFFGKLDTRLRYAKLFLSLGMEINCNQLQGEELLRHIAGYCIARGKSISRAAGELFMEMAGSDLQFIHNELDKLISYAGEGQEITREMVQEVASLAPGEAEQNAVFAMTEQIAAGDQKAALAALDRLLDAGRTPLESCPHRAGAAPSPCCKDYSGNFEDTAKAMGNGAPIPCGRQRSTHLVSPGSALSGIRCRGGGRPGDEAGCLPVKPCPGSSDSPDAPASRRVENASSMRRSVC